MEDPIFLGITWSKEVQIAFVSGITGIIGALAGAVIGARAAWRAAIKTNEIQEKIAKENQQLQKKLAEDAIAFQQKLAVDTARSQRWSIIEAMMMKMNEFALQHPHVEKDSYCDSYPNCVGHEHGKERYETYCVYVFNVLWAVFQFCEGDSKKIEELVGAQELIRRHHRCWLADNDNLDHDQKFRQYIQSVIDNLKKAGKIK